MCEDVVGFRCGVLELIFNETLDIPEPERVVGGIGAYFAVLAGTEEEEEGDPVEIAEGDFSWGGSLGGGVQVLDDFNREGPHSC